MNTSYVKAYGKFPTGRSMDFLLALAKSKCTTIGVFPQKKVGHGLSFPEFKNRVAFKPTCFHRAQYFN